MKLFEAIIGLATQELRSKPEGLSLIVDILKCDSFFSVDMLKVTENFCGTKKQTEVEPEQTEDVTGPYAFTTPNVRQLLNLANSTKERKKRSVYWSMLVNHFGLLDGFEILIEFIKAEPRAGFIPVLKSTMFLVATVRKVLAPSLLEEFANLFKNDILHTFLNLGEEHLRVVKRKDLEVTQHCQ